MMPERFLWGTGNGMQRVQQRPKIRRVSVSNAAGTGFHAGPCIPPKLISVGKPMWHQWQPVFLSVLACKALCKVMMVSKRALRPELIMLDRWVADDGQVCFMTTI